MSDSVDPGAMIATWRRFSALPPADRRLVLDTAWLMGFVWIGLRLLRFPTIRRCLDQYAKRGRNAQAVGSVCRAVAAVAAQFPGSATCLVQGLAADAMLRRSGHTPELRLGVRIHDDGAVSLKAHAWVDCEGTTVIGAINELPDYAVLS